MPIYDFKCTACGHQAEMMRKISDASTADCPICHKETLTKMLSAPSFQLSGTGWYATDFKNKNKPASPSAPKQETETKTEAPAATSCNPGCACH
jgi:putative FmdB family regulatory protein